jgi:hypothetical protein
MVLEFYYGDALDLIDGILVYSLKGTMPTTLLSIVIIKRKEKFS